MISEQTILTYLLANPNLRDEIHLKGVRFVTSQISKIAFHAYHGIFVAFVHLCLIFFPKNSKMEKLQSKKK